MLRRSFLQSLAGLAAGATVSRAQSPIAVIALHDKLHVLTGAGGNIAILEGQDGLLLVDSGLPETTAGLLASTGKIGKGKITRLINTHWHYDHTGANPRLGKDGARILAHENCLKRLSTKQTVAALNRTFEPLPAEGLPVDTFKDKGTLKYGSETLHHRYLPPAHTDGDIVVHFQNANVLHGGDLLFNGSYPFIDYSSGGSLAGMAANAESIVKMVDHKTKIIPGHGPVAQKKDIQEYGAMLHDCHAILARHIKDGKTVDEIKAARPFAKYDDKWGKGFIKSDMWIGLNYAGMKA